MKKLLITGTKQAEFVDSPTPACPTDGVVVKAKVTAISAGTEIRVFRGIAVDDAGKFMHETKPYELPCENGYSMVAEVMEVGKNVEHLAVGERVFVPEPHKEYAAVPSNLAVKLPETIPDEEAVMINILEVAHQGLRQGQPPVGGNVAVVGQGVIGLSALAYANAFGMRTASLDTDSTRLHIAEEMGTRLAASPVEEDAVARVYDLFDGAGADVTCEAASNWAGIRTAMEVTGIDGTVVVIARHTQQPDFNPVGHPFLGKRLRIVTTYAYPDDHDRWSRNRSFALTVDLLARRRLNIAPMLTHEFAWHELPDVYRRLDEGDKSIVGTTIRWDA